MFSWIIWLIFIALSIIVIVGYFGKRVKVPGAGKSWWPPSDTTQAIAGFGILYLLPYLFYDKILYWREVPFRNAPDGVSIAQWWYEKTVPWESPVGFLLIVFLILFGAMMKKDPKNPVHQKLAPYGLSLVGILLLFHFFGSAMGGTDKLVSWWNGNKPPATTSTMPATSNGMRRAETQDFVTTFWYKNLPIGDAWEMINIAQCESGFKHWDDNGNVVVNKNDDGSTDWGVMQVNDKAWGEKAQELGHDITSLGGNLAMALYIRKESGAQAWTCNKQVAEVKDEVTTIPAPAQPEWSPVQKVKANCIWENTMPIDIKDEKGIIHRKNPGEMLNIKTWTFEISVPEGSPPGEMIYTCW
jgi:hypothetical protein